MSPTPVETLRSAREILVERGWTKNVFVDSKGCCCALGALKFACGWEEIVSRSGAHMQDAPVEKWDELLRLRVEAEEFLNEALPEGFNGYAPTFNDADSTTYEDVLDLFDRAIALAEADTLEAAS